MADLLADLLESAHSDVPLLEKIERAATKGGIMCIGSYEVVRTLGKGSFGIVRLARRRSGGEDVAIKTVTRGELSKSPDQRRRSDTEIRILNSLNHPCICTLFEVIETENERHLVMEYLPGGELYDLVLKEGKLQPVDAYIYFAQTYAAVVYLHLKGIYHRDIKLENMLLTASGTVKLCDFGFAWKASVPHQKTKTHCGSPHYAAPEVIRQETHNPAMAEVWSLGVLLYALCTSTLPFDAPDKDLLFKVVMRNEKRFPPDLPASLVELIDRMLQLEAAQRISLPAIYDHSWFLQRTPKLQLPLRQALEADIKQCRSM
eukprot:Sspe_Gene.116599::Locus_106201_Transcript_1_1_Confidence_1.000_Length_1152::g.116599::m.116599/K08798/MARK; MAP/microtubule affinity-regulating kinase